MKAEKQIKNTKTGFMKAYAALSKRKAADKITVSDLCQEAEFSRNTFYTYYKNMEDFLTKSDLMILEDVMSEIGKYRFDMDFSHSIEFYTYIKRKCRYDFLSLGASRRTGAFRDLRGGKGVLPGWVEYRNTAAA